ncbi:outer membrane beta-barrel protein [Planctomicrobium piriforme]|uniref:Putative beta-barrel porin-2, OmpL-like. bbp2 n=1 Tax=Planctomicrobium piriforme TaxID=1576369 RepID=A0A1I3MSB5_9PLAN|nr:outer membrane beta-barrel protein [Planctomicrobium piriforme]SFI99994.1 Putative beta-barrel porin-2, OmpL-like. bbp2 [Planctomicrobium piriforme]
MRKIKTRDWLLSLATMLGVASSTYAQDNQYVKQAEAIFGTVEQPLIQQVSHESCTPACDIACDTGCDDACDAAGCGHGYLFGPDEAWDLGDQLFCEDSGWDIGGWSSWGFSTANDGVFATYPGHFQNNQTNLFVEKVADGSEGIGFGGRIDVMYGTDASNTQSFGNKFGVFDFNGGAYGVYGWAIPQLYAEVAYDKLSVKIGHFYTLLGYQVVPATGNFFYSIPYTFNFGEAFTHTGALATYKASDNLTIYGGYTFGWDTGFDQLNGGSSFLGGASVGVTDNVTATYILTAGNLGWIGEGYSHSIVIDYVINDKWEYVFQTDLDSMSNSPNGSGGPGTHYNAAGVNQYLFYTISDTVKAGARVEWWKADGVSMQEMAYGINYKPLANLTLRPEVRYNWSNGVPPFLPTVAPNASSVNNYTNNCLFMMDAVLTF